MAEQIKFFKKSKTDLTSPNINITVTDSVAVSTGQTIVDRIRNRNNRSAWRTTESTDAGTTTIEVSMGDAVRFDSILLIKNNFKSYTIQRWNPAGANYVDFSTPINETNNTESTSYHTFDAVDSSRIKIVITGTMAADEDKYLYQLIVTQLEGQLDAWPEIKNPRHVRTIRKSQMLSGKMNILEAVGRFSCELKVKYWKNDADLTLVEDLYFGRNPMLVWLCGGDEAQFSSTRIGYRREDLFLMRPVNDYEPEWFSGVYSTGLNVSLKLDEVVD